MRGYENRQRIEPCGCHVDAPTGLITCFCKKHDPDQRKMLNELAEDIVDLMCEKGMLIHGCVINTILEFIRNWSPKGKNENTTT